MQIQSASDQRNLTEICVRETDTIIESGYTLPMTSVTMTGKEELVNTLMLHHTLLRNKAELDQLKSGLSCLGVLNAMCQNPAVMEPFFVAGKRQKLNAGMNFIAVV